MPVKKKPPLEKQYYLYGSSFGACACTRIRGTEEDEFPPGTGKSLAYQRDGDIHYSIPGRDFYALTVEELHQKIITEQREVVKRIKDWLSEQQAILRQYESLQFRAILSQADGTSYEVRTLKKLNAE